jgi:RNA polymerase sigma-70 factor (ECF subfamily)
VSAQVIERANKEEAAIASVPGVPDNKDMSLVTAAKGGNRRAFELLVERHERKVFFVALRITRNREDAEDVVQQSFQKAFVRLNSFVGKSSFSTWLTRIAINEALMLLRKNRGSREVLIDDLNGNEETATPLEIPDSTPDPEAFYSQQEWAGMLSLAMNELTPAMRNAIQLRELDERSMQEAAQMMGISAAAAKARVFHGRRKLRESLKHFFGSAWTSGRDNSRTISNPGHILQDQVACNACG